MKGRAFVAVVLSALLLLSGLGIGGWWLLWQRGPLKLAHQPLMMPRAARFVPASASFSLYLFSDGQRPVDYARAVAPSRQRRVAGEAIARLRDGAFAAAGLDYQDELAGWLGAESAMALFEDPLAAVSGAAEPPARGWLLALASRDDDGARRFLQRFWQTRSLAGTDLQVSRYRGMGLISGRGALLGSRPEPLATALVDDDLVLIASGRNLLERALDVSQIPELNQAGQPLLRQGIASFARGAALAVASPQALQSWLGLPSLADLPAAAAPARGITQGKSGQDGRGQTSTGQASVSRGGIASPPGGASSEREVSAPLRPPVDITPADGGAAAASDVPGIAVPPAAPPEDAPQPSVPAAPSEGADAGSALSSGLPASSGSAASGAPAVTPPSGAPSDSSDAAVPASSAASAPPPDGSPPPADARGWNRTVDQTGPPAVEPGAAPSPQAASTPGDRSDPVSLQVPVPWAVRPAHALAPARQAVPATASLLAVLQPQGRQLELRARLLLPEAPQLGAIQPELAEALLSSLRGSPSSLALIQDPAALGRQPLLQPLLERTLGLRPQALAERQGPLPALLARSIHGPLLTSQASEGWQLATRAGDPAASELEPLLRQAGLLEAPLELDGHMLRVWTHLSLPSRSGRRDRGGGDALVAPLAGWSEQGLEQAWWGQTLAALDAPAESRALTALRRGLRELGMPQAPLQWSLDADTAHALLRAWQPWRLLSALAGGGLDGPVHGLALAVESPPEGSTLELRARLNLGA